MSGKAGLSVIFAVIFAVGALVISHPAVATEDPYPVDSYDDAWQTSAGNWVDAQRIVQLSFTGVPGKVVFVGDVHFANNYVHLWLRAHSMADTPLPWPNANLPMFAIDGYDDARMEPILEYYLFREYTEPADREDSQNGATLMRTGVDPFGASRGFTASPSVTTGDLLYGGDTAGLPSLDTMLSDTAIGNDVAPIWDAEVAVVLVGAYDVLQDAADDAGSDGVPDNIGSLSETGSYIWNLNAIVQQFQQRGIVVLLCTLPIVRDNTGTTVDETDWCVQYNAAIRAYAQEKSLPLLDIGQNMLDRYFGNASTAASLYVNGIDPDGVELTHTVTIDDTIYDMDDRPQINYHFKRVGDYLLAWSLGVKLVEIKENVIDDKIIPPTAVLTATPAPDGTSAEEGDAPLMVHFDASDSSDSDGTIVSYEWDFDGDAVADETTQTPTLTHIFDVAGSYVVTVNVIDDEGGWDRSDPLVYQVGGLTTTETFREGENGYTGYKDLYIDSNGSVTYWSSDDLMLQRDSTHAEVFLQADLSSLSITQGQLIDATLTLFARRENGVESDTSDTFQLERIDQSWNVDDNYTTLDGKGATPIGGSVYLKDYTSTNDINPPLPFEIDITALVRQWVGGTANYGLKLSPGATAFQMHYRSSDYATVEYRPLITIRYAGTTVTKSVTLITDLSGKTFKPLDTVDLTWWTAGIDAGDSTSNVMVSFSTDGSTYSNLLTGDPNDGATSVTLPDLSATFPNSTLRLTVDGINAISAVFTVDPQYTPASSGGGGGGGGCALSARVAPWNFGLAGLLIVLFAGKFYAESRGNRL